MYYTSKGEPTISLSTWYELNRIRDRIISNNTSRRIRGVDPLPVPDKAPRPCRAIAYKGGDYVGVVDNPAEYPNHTIKYEPAKW